MRILITGGAGFVGCHLARRLRRHLPAAEIVAFDNLRRRGSETNLTILASERITFTHGDIRIMDDLADLPGGGFDLFIEASAEPSVHAGTTGSPAYLLQTNLMGTVNCLEFARKRVKQMIFLSTSRVYSLAPLKSMPLAETDTQFVIDGERLAREPHRGVSEWGIGEEFPVHLPRSLYGASKLASELLIQEYVDSQGVNAVINRCGVIAGPGQFGKVDQGVYTLWVANHYFGLPLAYTGFGGMGKQVRDLLHPDDLFECISLQMAAPASIAGSVFNVGGGRERAVSLVEMTQLCREATGRSCPISSRPATASVDIPLYVSDTRKLQTALDWQPKHSVATIVADILGWVREHEAKLKPLFLHS